jgi:hypothetical protein
MIKVRKIILQRLVLFFLQSSLYIFQEIKSVNLTRLRLFPKFNFHYHLYNVLFTT